MHQFSMATFKIFYFHLVFSRLIINCPGHRFLWVNSASDLLSFWACKFLYSSQFVKFSGITSSNMFYEANSFSFPPRTSMTQMLDVFVLPCMFWRLWFLFFNLFLLVIQTGQLLLMYLQVHWFFTLSFPSCSWGFRVNFCYCSLALHLLACWDALPLNSFQKYLLLFIVQL